MSDCEEDSVYSVTMSDSEEGSVYSEPGSPQSYVGSAHSDLGSPHSDPGSPGSDVGSPHSDAGSARSGGSSPWRDVGNPGSPHSDAGSAHSGGSSPRSDAGSAHSYDSEAEGSPVAKKRRKMIGSDDEAEEVAPGAMTIYHGCNRCSGLFLSEKALHGHFPLCDSTPNQSCCNFFVCPKDLYIKHIYVELDVENSGEENPEADVKKRPRGRPRKYPSKPSNNISKISTLIHSPGNVTAIMNISQITEAKRPRGRPRKTSASGKDIKKSTKPMGTSVSLLCENEIPTCSKQEISTVRTIDEICESPGHSTSEILPEKKRPRGCPRKTSAPGTDTVLEETEAVKSAEQNMSEEFTPADASQSKSSDSTADISPTCVESKRPRGRPRKTPAPGTDTVLEETEAVKSAQQEMREEFRPADVSTPKGSDGTDISATCVESKRPRGRPRKTFEDEIDTVERAAENGAPVHAVRSVSQKPVPFMSGDTSIGVSSESSEGSAAVLQQKDVSYIENQCKRRLFASERHSALGTSPSCVETKRPRGRPRKVPVTRSDSDIKQEENNSISSPVHQIKNSFMVTDRDTESCAEKAAQISPGFLDKRPRGRPRKIPPVKIDADASESPKCPELQTSPSPINNESPETTAISSSPTSFEKRPSGRPKKKKVPTATLR